MKYRRQQNMQEYAKEVGSSLQFATDAEFVGVPNWRTNQAAARRKDYLPVSGEAPQREGYTATPQTWHVVQQSETRIEPRQTIVEDWETDAETGERRKTGEHTEMVDTEVTIDTSYISIDEWSWSENPPEPEPEQQEDISAQLQQVIELIMYYCDKYGATEELLAIEDINIAALTALIAKYQVTAEDQSAITNQILLIVLDIMGKLNQTWYVIWNDTVKPALNHIHQTRAIA
jgi:hypothetical protein